MTSYEKGQQAFVIYLDEGMIDDKENPFAEQSEAGEKWQRGYDDARNTYLR